MSAPITRRLDTTGTFCPLPILLAARDMMRLAAGDRLEIIGDDPAILEDMPIWCERAGHRLVEISERDGTIVSVVEKGGQAPSPRKRRGKAGGGGTGGAGGAGGGREGGGGRRAGGPGGGHEGGGGRAGGPGGGHEGGGKAGGRSAAGAAASSESAASRVSSSCSVL